jgi:hypothetical protein
MKRSQALMHGRHRLLIEISQNANHQIGRADLFDLFQRLLADEVTFHSSASVVIFFSARRTGQSGACIIYGTSDIIPIRGMRTHAGRLFNS